MVKERPILFSGAMVRAILEGRKTQTRRVIKLPPFDSSDATLEIYAQTNLDKCPYGKAGDRLWVRETWGEVLIVNFKSGAERTETIYRAENETYDKFGMVGGGWKPSIYMPRKVSRITLEIVGVRLERLQDISEQDAIAEGAKHFSDLPSIHPWGQDPRWSMEENPPSTEHCLDSARFAFANFWNKLNGDRGYPWDSNPFVWVVEFKKLGASSEQQLEDSCNG